MGYFNWKPPKVFYGWFVVGASFLIALYAGGVIFYGFTAFFEPIANDLGWSYTQISFAPSLLGVEMSFLAPLVGWLVDRWGPRRLIFSGATFTALGLMLLNRVTSLSMFYVAFVLIGTGMSTCSTTVIVTAVAHWFRRKIGIASGIAICGYGFGGLMVPVTVRLIDVYEWRMAVAILAVGMIAIVMPLSLLIRHKPEQYGYLPDGEASGTIADKGHTSADFAEVDIRAKQALKSKTFWHIQVALTCQMMVIAAMTAHVMPYLSSIGIVRSTAGLVASVIPLLSIGGRLGFGWLADKFDKRFVMAAAFAMMGLGLLCFEHISIEATWLLVTFFIFYGSGYGGGRALIAPLVREFFGVRNFGAITGFMNGIQVVGSLTGPPLAGWVFDNWGSYQGIWLVFAIVSIVSLISIATTPSKQGSKGGGN